MQTAIAIASFLTLFISLILFIGFSFLKRNNSSSTQVAELESSLETVSKDLLALSARIEQMDRQSMRLNELVDRRLCEIRTDNDRRLEQMRQTVEEKLQSTLETRLSSSFRNVGEQLEKLYTQLGEMQSLAKGVDNLEKTLTNVKTRGIWGELQAQRILQDILLPQQYACNVITKQGSRDYVEFAVKLPGASEGEHVLLPIDSKFPREDYDRLCDAVQSGDVEGVRQYRKALEQRLLSEAKDISRKYIDVPFTTDFAIMFLPVEGLYAEALSINGLQEKIQSTCHVLICGPATLASLLNSLQMGFRTLAIEKRSSEVWAVLGQVKTEFMKFEQTLEAVKKKLASASDEVEKAFVRQRVMSRKLKDVEGPEDSALLED